ncbi:acyl-CoA synthetase [Acidobacteria bacterium AH-259-L09]|nr:acyl-CoA synthetase [Acidobacteria bacterium AH-259-L09]
MFGDLSLPLMQRAAGHHKRLAIVDGQGRYSYADLLTAAQKVASCLLTDQHDLGEARVAFMVPPSFDYVAVQWGIWQAGGIAVPLCPSHPRPEIEYVIRDATPQIVVSHPVFENKLRPTAKSHNAGFLLTSAAANTTERSLPNVNVDGRAMILYTSGTTSAPKGVVMTHQNITAQIKTLIDAWEWTADDHIVHVLPLHHTHGIVNTLLCPLWAGATCEILPKFDAEKVWDRFVNSDLTLFMAVPTIYVKLIATWDKATVEEQKRMSKACADLRLMVSGSAALPVTVLEKWKAITGHTLLERYGMTEIGMVLSNPLHGERRPGFVGVPLPGVKVRVVDESGQEIKKEGKSGEIQVRGPIVFPEYWGKPEVTRKAFRNGWFCTGDAAVIERGYYRILGRSSVDIIKTGGYKVSALEIEEALRTHPAIKECAVVGVDDREWGERVGAAVIPEVGSSLSLDDLRLWAKKELASYKIPTRLLLLDELPRNAMGKVTKGEIKRLFEGPCL